MKILDLELPSNRKFGLFFTALFTVLGSYFWFQELIKVSYALFVLAASFLIVTLCRAELLLPLNKLWMRLGFLLGVVISPIVLGLMFFGIFTPISQLTKLFGRDELRLGLKTRESYWLPRDSISKPSESFKNQF
jgi:hypothetical protein